MPMNTVIVDDERPARDELLYLLKGFPEVNVVAQGKNGLEALALIKEHDPDLVFLDVQMPGLDGFGVIKKLFERKQRVPQIVFATAFDNYAIQAFDVNAVDYVLKPFDKTRIAKAMQRAKKMVEAHTSPVDRLETLMGQLAIPAAAARSAQPVKLLVKSQARMFLVDADDMIYASIQDGTITIFTRDFEGVSNYRTIEELAASLDADTFLARPPLVPDQHQSHQGSRPVVQIQLHAENERQARQRNSRLPRPDQAPARTAQAVARCGSSLVLGRRGFSSDVSSDYHLGL